MAGTLEVSQPTAECPEPKLWRCFDVQTAEVEVLEFMAQLVKTLKPKLIVETGAHRGASSFYMGRALKEVGRGKLITCEFIKEFHEKAVTLLGNGGLQDVVECRLGSSLEMTVEGTIDLLFVDSDPQIRIKEIQRFWNQLTTSSLIVVHDVNSGIHKPLRDEILQQDTEGKLSVVLLPTPRGLALCQKREGRV